MVLLVNKMLKSVCHMSRTVLRHKEILRFSTNQLCQSINYMQIRTSTVAHKRFYKHTGVIHSDRLYEVTLDNRKLKTPRGEVLKIENQLLALAVAAEWDAQKDTIQQSNMHLTSLCNTAQDNPNNINKFGAVQYLINFLDTDTILFYSTNDELNELQKREWGSVIDWFCKKFDVEISPTTNIENPQVPIETKQKIEKYLLSYSLKAIHGFTFGVEALKSMILMLACIERKINVSQAILLSRLEEEYQTGYWGRVEWGHDMEQLDTQSRLAASVIFIQLNSMSEEVKSKLISVM